MIKNLIFIIGVRFRNSLGVDLLKKSMCILLKVVIIYIYIQQLEVSVKGTAALMKRYILCYYEHTCGTCWIPGTDTFFTLRIAGNLSYILFKFLCNLQTSKSRRWRTECGLCRGKVMCCLQQVFSSF